MQKDGTKHSVSLSGTGEEKGGFVGKVHKRESAAEPAGSQGASQQTLNDITCSDKEHIYSRFPRLYRVQLHVNYNPAIVSIVRSATTNLQPGSPLAGRCTIQDRIHCEVA